MSEYKIIREVGKGGMGCVYEALDSYGNKVALKMLSAKAASDPDYREMFELEVRALRRLSNPSIVKIMGEPYSDAEGNLYLPMEFVDGETLTQIVQSQGPFDEQKALEVFSKLLDVFSYIHNSSCIHRDVKPSNIMIRHDGSVCVIDFGIAKDCRTSTGRTVGRIVGTDGYMSPEQADGYNIDARTDIYSLGCLLHYMLTGTHAIKKQNNDYDTICAILENNFPLVSDSGITVSDKVQKAILKAVNKNMTLRYQTAGEFKAALSEEGGGNVASGSYKVTVGRSNCDIVLPGECVSRHHLDIIWEFQNEKGTSCKVTVNDHSTNGIGINGVMYKNDSYTFMVDKSVPELLKDHSSLPQVLIAGLAEYVLDWTKVLYVLEPPHEPDEITLGYGILCFAIPVAGWVLGVVRNSKSATKLAWYGFAFYLFILFLCSVI